MNLSEMKIDISQLVRAHSNFILILIRIRSPDDLFENVNNTAMNHQMVTTVNIVYLTRYHFD